jgi:hypothetical protein
MNKKYGKLIVLSLARSQNKRKTREEKRRALLLLSGSVRIKIVFSFLKNSRNKYIFGRGCDV